MTRMSRPKKSYKGDEAFNNALAAVQQDQELTPEERQQILSGDAGISLYNQENKLNPKFDNRFGPGTQTYNFASDGSMTYGLDQNRQETKQLAPDAYAVQNINDNGATYRSYFQKAYEKIKKDKFTARESIKQKTDRPGLTTQTALGAPKPSATALGGGYR